MYGFRFGGGSFSESFKWEETADEVRLELLLDPTVTANSVSFSLKGQRLTVGVKGFKPFLQGTLVVSHAAASAAAAAAVAVAVACAGWTGCAAAAVARCAAVAAACFADAAATNASDA